MVQSPLANLGGVLRIVRESAASYESTLRKNEAATRAVLVDPVLRALGWDIANPFKVEVETPGSFGTSKVSADYALKANGDVVAVIEAKKLGSDLGLLHHQLVQYGFSFGINRLFLTDGLRWEHFTDLKPDDLSPSGVLDLGSDDLGKVAAYLVQELDAALVSPEEEQLNVLADQVEQIQQGVTKLRSLEKRVKELEEVTAGGTVEPPCHCII
jgi:predicted type IV restriction endonuclease